MASSSLIRICFMSDVVEIYICMPGQALKEGRVEVSHSIPDKHAAESDALSRIKINPKIHKIAYYRINDAGDFRIFYSYTNKDVAPDKPKASPKTRSPSKPKKAPKPTWWQKLLGIKP